MCTAAKEIIRIFSDHIAAHISPSHLDLIRLLSSLSSTLLLPLLFVVIIMKHFVQTQDDSSILNFDIRLTECAPCAKWTPRGERVIGSCFPNKCDILIGQSIPGIQRDAHGMCYALFFSLSIFLRLRRWLVLFLPFIRAIFVFMPLNEGVSRKLLPSLWCVANQNF